MSAVIFTRQGDYPIPVWLAPALEEIAALGRLPEDWTSYGCERPTTEAVGVSAKIVTGIAVAASVRPEHIAPMADGGIAIQYALGSRVVRLDVYNDAGIAIVTIDGDGEPQYDDVAQERAVGAVREFLGLV